MAKLEERIGMIGSAIRQEVEEERREILEQADRRYEEELQQFEETLIADMFRSTQDDTRQVRQDAFRQKAVSGRKAHRELLERREELCRSVFASVASRLHDYVKTEQYRGSLLESVGKLRDKAGAGCTVYLREADLDLSTKITAALGSGCRVEVDPSIRIGGFKALCLGGRILIDETLDNRLQEQKPWFREHSGLKTQE